MTPSKTMDTRRSGSIPAETTLDIERKVRRRHAVTAVLGITLAGGLVASLYQTRRAAGQIERATGELASLRSGLSRVEQESRRAPLIVQVPSRAPDVPVEPTAQTNAVAAPVGDSAAAPEPHAPLSNEQVHERRRLANERRTELCSDAHASETRDHRWATQAEQSIMTAHAGPEFQPLRVTTDCRSTICRIEFSYTDPVTGPEAARKFLATPAWKGAQFYYLDQEHQKGFSYLARESAQLPTVDRATLSD